MLLVDNCDVAGEEADARVVRILVFDRRPTRLLEASGGLAAALWEDYLGLAVLLFAFQALRRCRIP